MKPHQALFVLFAALGAACSPPAQQTAPTQVETTAEPAASIALTPEQSAIADVLRVSLTLDLEQEVTLRVAQFRQEGDWAFIQATPQTPDGHEIDWAQTKYAERFAAGMLDGGGETPAVLQRQNGVWVVREFIVGPTDVAYIGWPQKYGFAPSLIGE